MVVVAHGSSCKITYEIPYERSIKALMELALYFRALDDEQNLTDIGKRSASQGASLSKPSKVAALMYLARWGICCWASMELALCRI
jgi:hypothetical protein